MLSDLIVFNRQWLVEHEIDLLNPPIFLSSRNSLHPKRGKRLAIYEHCLNRSVVVGAPDALLRTINQQQSEKNASTNDSSQIYNLLDLKINPRRLRKTFATHAAACGVEALLLAEMLDHEDLQHVMLYYKLGASFALKLNQVYEDGYGPLLKCFKGQISLGEVVQEYKNQTIYGPDSLRKLMAIGFCSKDKRCRLAPPYSCYGCGKFEACNDKKIHTEVLNAMVQDVEDLFGKDVVPGKFDMIHIQACKDLISQLDGSNSNLSSTQKDPLS